MSVAPAGGFVAFHTPVEISVVESIVIDWVDVCRVCRRVLPGRVADGTANGIDEREVTRK